MTGQIVDHYRIAERLGGGGMGIVYRAFDSHLGRSVAIKVLRSNFLTDPARKRRFIQEAKAASALNHPNIVTIHDVGVHDGRPAAVEVLQFVDEVEIDDEQRQGIARAPGPAEFPFQDSAWSIDSQSVYYASAASVAITPREPGLWRASLAGGEPESLINQANTWWPAQSSDGALRFFMQPPAFAPDPDYLVFPFRLDASAGEPVMLNSPGLVLNPNDTFNVRWTRDAGQYVAQIVRPALDDHEVLLYDPDGSPPPLFLMQDIGQFRWGP